jgi:hypothetical protein
MDNIKKYNNCINRNIPLSQALRPFITLQKYDFVSTDAATKNIHQCFPRLFRYPALFVNGSSMIL